MYPIVSSSIVGFIVLLKYGLSHESGCSIPSDDNDMKQPLILNEHFEFLYPEDGTQIKIRKNERLFISCIDENNFKLKRIKSSFVNITCVKDDTFLLGNDRVELGNLKCKKYIKSTARRTKKKCGKSFQEIEIGYAVSNQFIRVLQICFDPNLQTTIYSHFTLTKWISKAQNAQRISWRNDLYNSTCKDIEKAYSKKFQKKHINSLLQLSPNSNEVVKNDNRHYLARGHLAAKADFYYVHQQSATFFTVNAAPQWQSFNNGNWKTLEIAIRKFAATRRMDLEIYTGTFETLEMSNAKTKTEVEISLLGNNKTSVLPVPLFFWKIVYEPKSQSGVAFVGVNNPFITRNELKDLQICRNILEGISWVKFVDKLDLGYCYACRLRDFLRVVKNAPRLKGNDILK